MVQLILRSIRMRRWTGQLPGWRFNSMAKYSWPERIWPSSGSLRTGPSTHLSPAMDESLGLGTLLDILILSWSYPMKEFLSAALSLGSGLLHPSSDKG